MAEPPVTLLAFHHDGPGSNGAPTRVVIHATAPGVGYPKASAAGMAASTARYFAGPAAGGSAHYVVDVAGEQHCVPDDTIAWHAPPNQRSLGIEICAEATYTRAQWLSDSVWPAVLRAAARTAELCTRFGIPVAYISSAALVAGARGICGHVDVSNAWHQSTHTDPGPGFPWPEFLTAVQAAAHPSGGFLMALTDDEQEEILVAVRALKAGVKLPARSVNCRVAVDDQYGHTMNAEAEAADGRVAALAAVKAVSDLTAALKAKGVL